MDSCFAEIPVWVDGSVQFIDVETLVLKVHGVQESCNNFLPLTVRAVESWVEINHHVTAVKSPPMVKHPEGEISEAPISELYSSWTLKEWENNLQYPYFQHAARSRLELGECYLKAGCLQGGDEEFMAKKHTPWITRWEEQGWIGKCSKSFHRVKKCMCEIYRNCIYARSCPCNMRSSWSCYLLCSWSMECLSSPRFCCLQCLWTCKEL